MATESSINADSLIKYFKLNEELEKLSSEISYLEKLLELARRKLSIKELQMLGDHLAKIRKKLENLNLAKEKVLDEMRRAVPEYKKQSEIGLKIVNFFFKLKETAKDDPSSLIEISKRLKELKQKAERAYNVLNATKEQLDALLKSGYIKDDAYIKRINEEITSIENITMLLGRIVNLLEITPENLNFYWSLLGYFVIVEEPKTFLGVVTGVKISKNSLKPLLEVSTENIISEAFLNELFKEVGADFKARKVEEFIDRLHDETKKMFGVETDITPMILERIFSKANVTIPKELQRQMVYNYEVKYYVDASKIRSERVDARNRIIKIFKGEFVFSRDENVANLPSLVSVPKELLLKEISLGRYNYWIYTSTVLPEIGNVVIVLRRDENNEPVPVAKFARKILELLEKARSADKSKKIPVKLGDRKLERMSDDRILWILRLAIVKGIGTKYNVTEGNALRPKNLFQFLLEYNLPILYEDLIAAYFGVVPSSNLVKINAFVDFKVKQEPTSIKHWLKSDVLMELFRQTKPHEIIGLTFHKKKGVSIKFVDQFPERKIYTLVHEKYGISEDILRRFVQKSIRRLFSLLILQGKISSFEDYKAVQEFLGVKTIEYEKLIKPFKDPGVFLLYRLLQLL